jgi:hypothetical protein
MKSFELRIFRATTGAWIGEFTLPIIFFAVLSYTAVEQIGLPTWVALLGLAVILMIAASEYILPMLRSWIQFGRSTIEGSVNGRAFHLYYAEVLAAWIIERRRQRYLCLGTSTGTIIFPLRFFDDCAVWSEVCMRLPQEVLGDQAIQRLPDYKSWASEQMHYLSMQDTPRAVTDHWSLQIFGWGGLTFALFAAVAGFRYGLWESGIGFSIMALGCISVLFRWGITELSTSHVKRNTMFNRYSISWKEVVRIEQDPLGLKLVLVGDNCQLVIPGPSIWSRLGKRPAIDLFETQLRMRCIPVHKTILALVKFSHRTRMAH